MGWIIKSESNIDRVWVEVDDQLNETGKSRLEQLVPTPTNRDFSTPTPISDHPSFTPAPAVVPTPLTLTRVVALSAATATVVDLVLAVLWHVL